MPCSDIMPQGAIPVNQPARLLLTSLGEHGPARILHLANRKIAHLADVPWAGVGYNGERVAQVRRIDGQVRLGM